MVHKETPPCELFSLKSIFFLTFQQHRHQWGAVAVLGLLHQQLAVIQDVSDGVAPLDDAVHNVAGVVLLVGAERLEDKKNPKKNGEGYGLRRRVRG